MARTKKNLFAALGWVAWTALSKVGVPYARRRVQQRTGGGRARH